MALAPAASASAPAPNGSAAPAEERVVLHGISWETYEQLLDAQADGSAPRFTYDRGELEIMSPKSLHERISRVAQLLVMEVALETGVRVFGAGSTTFRRRDLARGFEPDACFYTRNIGRVRGKTELDPSVDPPPDLVVEIDISHSSLPKLPILADFGVPEVWRYDGTAWHILLLSGQGYEEVGASRALPAVTRDALTEVGSLSSEMDDVELVQHLRTWLRGSARRDPIPVPQA